MLSSQLNASSFLRKSDDFGSAMFKAGDSRPAIASLLPRIMSAGLNAGGERGDVS